MVLLYGYGVDSGIEAITPRPISLTPEYYTLTGLRLQQPPTTASTSCARAIKPTSD